MVGILTILCRIYVYQNLYKMYIPLHKHKYEKNVFTLVLCDFQNVKQKTFIIKNLKKDTFVDM